MTTRCRDEELTGRSVEGVPEMAVRTYLKVFGRDN